MFQKKKLSISAKLAFRFTFFLSSVVIMLIFIFARIQIGDINRQRSGDIYHFADILEINYNKIITENSNEPYSIRKVPRYINFLIYNIEEKKINIIATNSDEIFLLSQTGKKTKSYHQRKTANEPEINIIYLAHPLEKYPNVIIQIWIDLQNDHVYQMKKRFPQQLLLSLIPIFIICFFITWFIAKRIMNPIVKMTESAKQISSTNLDLLLSVKNNGDELDELAKTFNDLFNRLKIDFEREKQFTSDVSHELKTPVAVILGQANLIRRWGKDDSKQLEKSIATIISETKAMETIIYNLLQMTKIENGQILPQKESFLLSEFTDEIVQELEVLDNSAVLNFDFPKNLSINTDYALLHQVFMILISNSLKFCSKPIVINFKAVSKDKKTIISISDNGQGFSKEILEHVFERFFRGDDAHTRSVGGSGLGLSIAKTIVQSLGGTICASNDENTNGAKITITL